MKLFIITNRNLYINVTKDTNKIITNQYTNFFPILIPNWYSIFAYLSPLPLTDSFHKRFIYVSAVSSMYFEVDGARI